MNSMNTLISETEILAVFRQLGILTDEERQKALFVVNYGESVQVPQSVRFDIGFNASLPRK